MLALTRINHDPQTARYIAKQRAKGKTNPEAIRCLKRHLVRRVYHLLRDPNSVPNTVCLTYEPFSDDLARLGGGCSLNRKRTQRLYATPRHLTAPNVPST